VRILAGDIGGTKTLVQIADVDVGQCDVVLEQRFESARYSDFSALLHEFLEAATGLTPQAEAACFGVAGPVTGDSARVTNLPWQLDAVAIGKHFGIPRVRLINDFQAVGYGIEALAPDDLRVLQAGKPRPHGPRAVIGAGTGLGEGLLVWQGGRYEMVASEGGHVDFAPLDELQWELLHHLMQQFEHVSYDRIVCGSGLVRIYEFLRARPDSGATPELHRAMQGGDPAAAISQAALHGADPLARQALDLFVQIYGAQTGNLALTAVATGGVFVAGGIAPKIIDKLTDGDFIRAFTRKGRMSDLLATIPVQVVLNPRVGLLGAALAASRL